MQLTNAPIDLRERAVRESADSENTEAVQVNGDAIAELAELAASNEVTIEDLSLAVIELAEIIGGGEQ